MCVFWARWRILARAHGALLVLAPLGAVAQADPPRTALDWYAPAGCPEASAIREQLQAALSEPGEATHVSVDARVKTTPEGYALTLKIRTALRESSSVAQSPDCGELAEAVVLLTALATYAERSVEPEPPPAPPPSPPPRPEPQPGPRRVAVAIHAGVHLGGGRQSDLAVGPVLSVAIVRERVSVGLGTHQFLQTQRTARIGDVTADVEMTSWGLGLAPCYEWLDGISPRTCVGIRQIWLRAFATGDGLESEPGTARWAEATGLLGLAIPLSQTWSLRAGVEIAVPFERERLAIAGAGVVHRVGSATWRVPLQVGGAF